MHERVTHKANLAGFSYANVVICNTYQNITIPEMYHRNTIHIAMLVSRYFCSVQLNNKSTLFISFIEGFSLFLNNAVHLLSVLQHVNISVMKFWYIAILYHIVTTQYLDTRHSVPRISYITIPMC